jgi:sialate O-acetylesterase
MIQILLTGMWMTSSATAAETPTGVVASVQMPAMFSSRMVLQRDMPVPIWGTAAPGAKVTIKFRNQTKAVTADADGKWKVMLDPLTAGGPDVLQVNEVALEDVLVGEVWLGAGQSNMEATIQAYAGDDPVLAKLAQENYPQIRCLPDAGAWQECSPKTAPWRSAQLFVFGVRLQEELKVPVGLIWGALGNTTVGDWITEDMMKSDEKVQAAFAKLTADYNAPENVKRREEKLAAWERAVAAAKAAGQLEPNKPQLEPPVGGVYGHRFKRMGTCFEERILHRVGYGIRGMVWDQGENGVGLSGLDWGTAMHALINGWRRAWGQLPSPAGSGTPTSDFPVLYIEKPSGIGCAWDYDDPVTSRAMPFEKADFKGPMGPGVGPGREWNGISRGDGLGFTNTYLIQTRDLGGGMHPANKSGYGTRGARVALVTVYGKPIEYCGPVYEKHVIEGSKVRVFFTHVGKGLAVRHSDQLQGFGIADRTGQGLLRWCWAEAVIEKDPVSGRETVVVSAPEVTAPAAVCYSWIMGKSAAWANLFNQDGLPAQTFVSAVAEEPKTTADK